jgi:hypothetical protein
VFADCGFVQAFFAVGVVFAVLAVAPLGHGAFQVDGCKIEVPLVLADVAGVACRSGGADVTGVACFGVWSLPHGQYQLALVELTITPLKAAARNTLQNPRTTLRMAIAPPKRREGAGWGLLSNVGTWPARAAKCRKNAAVRPGRFTAFPPRFLVGSSGRSASVSLSWHIRCLRMFSGELVTCERRPIVLSFARSPIIPISVSEWAAQ